MADIMASALIDQFKSYLADGDGYIWGTAGVKWTEAKQKALEQTTDKDRANSRKYGSQWIGHMVEDCSGAFTRAFKALGGEMYHGSNTMYLRWCTSKGKLTGGKRTDGKELKPGTAVFVWNRESQKYGHVGLYVGDGTVIEAMGARNGVTTSRVNATKWTNWGELKGVNYGEEPGPSPEPAPDPKPEKGYAIVTGKQVALREGPSTSAKVLVRVPTGDSVKIETPPNDWEYVSYHGKTGYMMKKYLKEG